MPPYRMTDRPMLTPPVVPLTLRNRQGDRYARTSAVEAQLRDLVALATRTAQEERIETSECAAEEFVNAEAVAYFLRECHHARETRAVDWLAARTLERCEGFFRRHLWGLHGEAFQDARGTVVAQMFRLLLDLEHPSGEYYQVRFWNKLHRQCIDAYRTAHDEEHWALTHIARSPGDDDDSPSDPLAVVPDTDSTPEERAVNREAVAAVLDRFRALPPDQVQAYMLRHVQGWSVGEKDKPGTIAYLFGKSARTINNWDRAVAEQISTWLPGEGEA